MYGIYVPGIELLNKIGVQNMFLFLINVYLLAVP